MPKDDWDKSRRRDTKKQAERELASGAASSFEFLRDDPKQVEWSRGRRCSKRSLQPAPKRGKKKYTGSRKAGEARALRLCEARTRQKTRLKKLRALLAAHHYSSSNSRYNRSIRCYLSHLGDYHNLLISRLRREDNKTFIVTRGVLIDALFQVQSWRHIARPDSGILQDTIGDAFDRAAAQNSPLVTRLRAAIGIVEVELVYHQDLSELLSTIRNRAWVQDSVLTLTKMHRDDAKAVGVMQRILDIPPSKS